MNLVAEGSPVVVFVVAIGTVIALAICMLPGILRARRAKRIRETGVDATATVLEIIDTRSRSNHNPVCDVVLRVEHAGGAPFEARTRMVLSVVDLTRFQEGSVVPVKFDPADKTEVVVIRG